MANRFDIKTKTFFQLPPSISEDDQKSMYPDRIVFMDQGFDLNRIHYISECVQVGELWYQFHVLLACPTGPTRLDFDFKRKNDCLMAQRELSRAWTRTGEFKYEDVPSGESSTV